jgi:hypothetical protein
MRALAIGGCAAGEMIGTDDDRDYFTVHRITIDGLEMIYKTIHDPVEVSKRVVQNFYTLKQLKFSEGNIARSWWVWVETELLRSGMLNVYDAVVNGYRPTRPE